MSHVLVLGAGNGGLALAADLVRRGIDVALYNRGETALRPLREQGGVRYEGVLGAGFARLRTVTTDLASVVDTARVAIACVPATAHTFLARQLAPLMREDLTIVLHPGGMFGSVAFLHDLRLAGYAGRVRIAETGTLAYICRTLDAAPATVRISSVLSEVPFAALPGSDTTQLADVVGEVLPSVRPMRHVLEVGLTNVNAVLHPPVMVLAAAWIERSGGDFLYYQDTAVPSVARLMAALDGERLAVARAWGIAAEPFLELFARIGSTSAEAAARGDFLQALQDSEPNRLIKAPPSLDHRYMHEDMPFGAVPLADMGRLAGVPTPSFDAVIALASTVTGRDFRAEGRTLARVGLDGLSCRAIVERLELGPAD